MDKGLPFNWTLKLYFFMYILIENVQNPNSSGNDSWPTIERLMQSILQVYTSIRPSTAIHRVIVGKVTNFCHIGHSGKYGDVHEIKKHLKRVEGNFATSFKNFQSQCHCFQ